MKRFHVHVAVEDLAASIRFYSSLFTVQPSVMKNDYAKWMLDDPRINFAISQRGAQTGLNHLGIQVESDTELTMMQSSLDALQPGVEKEEGVACCYAKSDKYWVTDPSGIAWETFHTLDNIPVFGDSDLEKKAEQSGCCVPDALPMQRQAAQAAPGQTACTGKCC